MGKDGVDISPTQTLGTQGDKTMSPLWPLQRDPRSVPVRPSDDNWSRPHDKAWESPAQAQTPT